MQHTWEGYICIFYVAAGASRTSGRRKAFVNKLQKFLKRRISIRYKKTFETRPDLTYISLSLLSAIEYLITIINVSAICILPITRCSIPFRIIEFKFGTIVETKGTRVARIMISKFLWRSNRRERAAPTYHGSHAE